MKILCQALPDILECHCAEQGQRSQNRLFLWFIVTRMSPITIFPNPADNFLEIESAESITEIISCNFHQL